MAELRLSMPRRDKHGNPIIREYTCSACQVWHREGIDVLYLDHLDHQGVARMRPPSAAELFVLYFVGEGTP